MTESPSARDFTFFKWFTGIATVMVVGFSAFLFNVAIDNQTHIREALIEIRNMKLIEQNFDERLDDIEDRFNDLSQDPIHGWGQRWSRQEADRENSRQDKKLDRLESQLDSVRVRLSELQVPLSRTEASLQTLTAQIGTHMALPAHSEAGKEILLLGTKVKQLIKTLELHSDKHPHPKGYEHDQTHQ